MMNICISQKPVTIRIKSAAINSFFTLFWLVYDQYEEVL